MKKLLYLLTLSGVFFIGCKDDPITDTDIETPNCDALECSVTSEYYGVGLLNGECWYAEQGQIYTEDPFYLTVLLTKGETNGITDVMFIDINKFTNLNDTIWLGFTYSNDATPNLAYATYRYSEEDTNVGDFSFEVGSPLTYQDYLLIDYFNADTTIVEGRFQVHFPLRRINPFVTHAPDSMRIECGRFRAQAQ